MYIRIKNNNLRYRVSLEEAEQLLAGQKLSQAIQLSATEQLAYDVSLISRQSHFAFDASANRFSLYIEKESLEQEVSERPSKKGIEFIQKSKDANVTFALEVDLKRKK
jgi:hypothetical protein